MATRSGSEDGYLYGADLAGLVGRCGCAARGVEERYLDLALFGYPENNVNRTSQSQEGGTGHKCGLTSIMVVCLISAVAVSR
jgi:hypothetical protein